MGTIPEQANVVVIGAGIVGNSVLYHLAKQILAINTDSEAPMVSKADYAVIGDLHEIVPALSSEIRKLKAG
jgi:electron transfer flavoprotein alpha subunit